MKLRISNKEIQQLLNVPEIEFPKYLSPIINLANRFAQGTRPKTVGQLSELINDFEGENVEEWYEWYKNKYPDAIKDATEKIYAMINNFKSVLENINKEQVEKWVVDLVIVKTFLGLRFQEAILKKVAEIKKVEYKLSNKEEESKGIDGYLGNMPVSIKPITYKTKSELIENIDVNFIFYKKNKNNIEIEFNF